MHYLSAQSERVKSGIAKVFFLQTLHVCSDEFLEQEIAHVFEVFKRLRYPKAFITRCLRKAKKIRGRSTDSTLDRIAGKVLVVPNNKQTFYIGRSLRNTGIKLVESTGTKVRVIISLFYYLAPVSLNVVLGFTQGHTVRWHQNNGRSASDESPIPEMLAAFGSGTLGGLAAKFLITCLGCS